MAEDQLARAHDLAISAIMGETIYKFGELVSKQKNLFVWCTDQCLFFLPAYLPDIGRSQQHPT
jgi:hypothetical protein